MSGPDRIWAFDYDLQDNDGTWRNWQCWSEDHPKPLNASEYILRAPAVLAALPEVQALIAAAYEVAAKVVDTCNAEGPYQSIGAAGRIRALTPPADLAAKIGGE